MSTEKTAPPGLEQRFQEPKGWRWHSFTRNGRHIRFGSVFPEDAIPSATIVCLQGLREFSEKYFEIAHWCLDNNFAFWTFDWAGQGKSTRFLENVHKRHSEGFDADIDDLHMLMMDYIKHSSVHPDKGRVPMVMLGHSMGGHLGLRYLAKNPDIFECAAFTAPMSGIKAIKCLPNPLALVIAKLCQTTAGTSYLPGGDNWGERQEMARLSSDPVRKELEHIWCSFDPELQTGDVTFGWVYEAQKSCIALQKPATSKAIKTTCLFGLAEHEDLVNNTATRKIIGRLQHAKILECAGSYHEILMEQDHIRSAFLDAFYTLIKENVIDRPETLKPF